MPEGAGDGAVGRTGLRAEYAAVLESACRLAAPTPASHDALWTAFADLIAAGRTECSSAIRIVAENAIRPNENA